MKIKRRIITIALITALFLACGFPSEEEIKQAFRNVHPTYAPISAVVGEGDGSAANYHIRYRKPNDNTIYEQVWLYLEQRDGKIELTIKGKEKIVD